MQIKNEHVGPMTNNEVLAILNKQGAWLDERQKKYNNEMSTKQLFPAMWIGKETASYLKETSASRQSREDIGALLQELGKIDVENQLTRMEKLQIINLRPTSEPFLYSIVNQCRRKFPQQKDIDALLEVIARCLPDDEQDDAPWDDESNEDVDDDREEDYDDGGEE